MRTKAVEPACNSASARPRNGRCAHDLFLLGPKSRHSWAGAELTLGHDIDLRSRHRLVSWCCDMVLDVATWPVGGGVATPF